MDSRLISGSDCPSSGPESINHGQVFSSALILVGLSLVQGDHVPACGRVRTWWGGSVSCLEQLFYYSRILRF